MIRHIFVLAACLFVGLVRLNACAEDYDARRYCIIDVSSGAESSSYPISFSSTMPIGDEYKLTKIVLRKIPAGVYKMCNQAEVKITEPFYIGVYHVTCKQYMQIAGARSSYAATSDKKPANSLSYDMLRGTVKGARWPASKDVDENSFIGLVRERTGVTGFDLPTEAQFEYACRAGTTSLYHNGGNTEADLSLIGSYSGNGCTYVDVGLYLPNNWGLYDTQGNIFQWCLDWGPWTITQCSDPVGNTSGSRRCLRGGCFAYLGWECTTEFRYYAYGYPSNESAFFGVRLACPAAALEQLDNTVRSQTVDGVEWKYVLENDVAIVANNGATAVSGNVPQEIVVPASLGGYPVKRIGRRAFSGCDSIVSISLPYGVTEIGEHAFDGCGAMEAIEIPTVVTNIGIGAFCGCSNLVDVVIPEGLKFLPTRAFKNCSKLKRLIIPAHVSEIGSEAFLNCSSLTELVIPTDVVSVGLNAFAGCASLTRVTFLGHPPKGLAESGLDESVICGLADVQISPPNGTIIDVMLDVVMTTSWKDGVVRYTTDGSVPTKESSVYSSPISIHGKKTLRAATFVDGFLWSDVVSATYGIGKVKSPVFNPGDGHVFYHNGERVTIACDTKGVQVRYTINGGDPTESSTLYEGPISISRTSTIRAKAFGHSDYIDSDISVANFVREWTDLAAPMISPDGGSFVSASQRVALSCESEGAQIYYTLDGTIPSRVNGHRYEAPFDIYESTLLKAIALRHDWADSDVSEASFERADAVGPAINCYGKIVDNDQEHPWTVDTQQNHDGVCSAKSASVVGGSSRMKLTVVGNGRLSFWWKASCEAPYEGYWFDYCAFKVGDVESARIAGETGWQCYVTNFTSGVKHVLSWEYFKDNETSEGNDCVWVDQVVWVPANGTGETLTSATRVPYAWLDKYGLAKDSDYETAAKTLTGKVDAMGRKMCAYDDYLAGTDPTNKMSTFQASVAIVNQQPVISWKPDLNENGKYSFRNYRIWGRKTLDDESDWEYPTNSLHRFFKVTVDMPL